MKVLIIFLIAILSLSLVLSILNKDKIFSLISSNQEEIGHILSYAGIDPFSFESSDERLIGYEFLNSAGEVVLPAQASSVHIWNNKSEYFFNISSGIQWTENYKNYWTRNVFCLGYYAEGEWNKIKCADELSDFQREIITDNSTYVNATLWKDFTYGGYDLRLAVRYSLKLNDNNLTIQIYGKNRGIDIPYDLGFAWIVKDIKIGTRQEGNFIKINGNNYALHNETFDDVTNITTFIPINYNFTAGDYKLWREGENRFYITLDWDEGLNDKVMVVENQYNANVRLLINAGLFSAGQEKSTIIYWADPTSYPAASFIFPTPDDGVSISTKTVIINISINETLPVNMTYTWNGTSIDFFDQSVMYNFQNLSVLGENATRVADLSKYSTNGTPSGATWTSNGKYGGGYNFDGNDMINIEDYTNHISAKGNFDRTYSFWINFTDITTVAIYTDCASSDFVRVQLALGVLTCGASEINFITRDMSSEDTGTRETLCGANAVANQWTHYAFVYSNSTGFKGIYINGVLNASTTTSVERFTSTASSKINLGKSCTSSSYFTGSIDEFQSWNKSLSASEINLLYMSNLQKHNLDEWTLTVNQTFNSSTQLYEGTYNYSFYLENTAAETDSSQRSLTIDLTDPYINFSYPTPANGSTLVGNSIFINMSSTDDFIHHIFVDFNNDLLGWWEMDWRKNDTYIYDNSSYKNDLITTATPYTYGKIGNSLYFNESNYEGIIPHMNKYSLAPLTIDVWVNFKRTPMEFGKGTIMYKNGTDGISWILSGNYIDNRIVFEIRDKNDLSYTGISQDIIVEDTWYHIVARVNESFYPTIYVDGVEGSNSGGTAPDMKTSDGDIILGKELDSSNGFNGYIDNLKIYSRTLNEVEILASFNAINPYYRNFTDLPPLPLYVFQGYVIDDAANLNSTILHILYYDLVAPYIIFVAPTPANNTQQNITSVKINISMTEERPINIVYNWNGTNYTIYNNSLVLMYNFDNALSENLVVQDISIWDNDGLILLGANYVNGKFGKAMSFFNTNNGVVGASNKNSVNLTGNFSITLWVNPNQTDYSWMIPTRYGVSMISKAEYQVGGYMIGINKSGKLVFTTESSGSDWTKGFDVGDYLPLNTWTHLGMTFNGTGINCYVNGVKIGGMNAKINATNKNLYIGKGTMTGWDAVSFNGTIDEVKIWNRELSYEEIYISSVSNLNKYTVGGLNPDRWILYINQSLNATTGLINGTYTYFGYAKDVDNNEGQTETRTIIIGTEGGAPPADEEYPQFSDFKDNNATLTGSGIATFNVTILNSNGTVYLNINNTNYTATNLTSNNEYNISVLMYNGTYSYFWLSWGNGTSHNFNTSETKSYTINDTVVVTDTIYPQLNFTSPTPPNATSTTNTSIEINISIIEQNLANITFNWNGTNFIIYDDSLVLMYNFDNRSALGENDTHVKDLSKYGNDGTVNGGSGFYNLTGGKYGGAFFTQGDYPFNKIDNNPSFNSSLHYSICFWIKPEVESTDEWQDILVRRNTGGVRANEIIFYISRDDNILTFSSWKEGSEGSTCDTSTTPDYGIWQYYCGYINNSNSYLYKNGILVSSTSSCTDYHINNVSGTFQLLNDFNGSIDNLMVWNRSLSASEINQLYMTNLQKFNSTNWNLYVNQSKNSTAGLDVGNYTYQAFATDTSNNQNSTELRTVIISSVVDTIYPSFINLRDNNATLTGTGTAWFNVTILNSNGTAILHIGTNNIVASNLSSVFNVSLTLTTGTYLYNWTSYGNGTSHNLNTSANRYYTVNSSVDAEYPQFSANKTSPNTGVNYNFNRNYQFNITLIKTNGTAGISFNNTNYTLTNLTATSNIFNRTLPSLGVGNYTYYFWAYGNGTSHLYNWTETSLYVVLKNATTSSQMSLAVTSSVEYPKLSDFVGSETNNGDAGCSYSINVSNRVWHVGVVNANYSTAGCSNYSYGEVTASQTINQNRTLKLILTATTPITYGTATNFAGSNCPSELTCSLNVTNGVYGVGIINANYSTAGNTNYSWNSTSFAVTINIAGNTLIPLLNNVNANLSIVYPSQVNATISGSNSTKLLITINGTAITSGTNYTWGVGEWIVTWNLTANTNYTGNQTYRNLSISRNTTIVYTYINMTRNNFTAVNNTARNIWLNCSSTATQGEVTALLDGTIISSNLTKTANQTNLNSGYYNFTCLYPQTQNYTLGVEWFYINVTNATALLDEEYPIFSLNKTSPNTGVNYNFNRNYQFNITLIKTNGTAGISFNNTNYTITNLTVTSSVFNKTFLSLGVGNYTYYYWSYGNGTSHNYNWTETSLYVVLKNSTTSSQMSISRTAEMLYGTTTDFSGSNTNLGDNDCSYALNVTNGIFPVGLLWANYSTPSCSNYSYGEVQNYINISKAGQILTPLLNGATGNLSITFPQQINASISGSNLTKLTITINGTSVIAGNNYSWGVGGWIVTWNLTANTNYTGNQTYRNLSISPALGNVSAYINHTRANFTAINNTARNIWLNCTRNAGETSILSILDGVTIAGGTSTGNQTNLNTGFYNFTCLIPSTQNYTLGVEWFYINVTNYTAPAPSTIPLINFTYPTPANDTTQSGNSIFVNVTSDDDTEYSVFTDFNGDLRLWLRMDEKKNATYMYDNSTYGNNGTIIGNPSYSAGKRGEAINLSGDYITVPNKDYFYTAPISIDFWVKFNQPPADEDQGIMVMNATNPSWIIAGDPTANKIVFEARDITNNAYKVISSEVTNGTWYHIVAMINSSNYTFMYMDGVKQTTCAPSCDMPSFQTADGNLLIGVTETGYLNGSIDDVKIYSRTLSEQEILASYNAKVNPYYRNFTDLAAGTYNFKAYAQDLDGNVNTTETRTVTIGVPIVIPIEITIVSPQAITYTISRIDFNISLNTTASSCYFQLDDPINTTMTRFNSTYYNYTSSSVPDGIHTVIFYCNDTGGNITSAERTFAVDTVPPMITLNYPLTTTYLNYSNVYMNYTPTDVSGLDTCELWGDWGTGWHKNQSDNSITSGLLQSFIVNFSDGRYKWNVWCNDTTGASDYSAQGNQTFYIDTTPPVINIIYPINTTYYLNVTELNYTLYDLIPQACWYSLDNGVINTTIGGNTPCEGNITGITSMLGSNTWTIWANDTLGHISNASITFSVTTAPIPIIEITYPESTDYKSVTELNYTVSTINLQSCWYSLDNGTTNITVGCSNGANNISGLISIEGINTWTIWVNNTDNINSDYVTFIIDNVAPLVEINSPLNQTYNESTTINISMDEDGDCNYTLDDGITNLTLTAHAGNTQFIGSLSVEGSYTLYAYCLDVAGNVNNTEYVIFYMSIPVPLRGVSGAGYLPPRKKQPFIPSIVTIIKGIFNKIYSFGGMIYPKNSIIGIVFLIGLLFLLFTLFLEYRKKIKFKIKLREEWKENET